MNKRLAVTGINNTVPQSARGECYYLEVFRALAGVPIRDRGQHAAAIRLFLNRWNARLSRTALPIALNAWLSRESAALEQLDGLAIDDTAVPGHQEEFTRLYDSLLQLRQATDGYAVHTMGDAAAAKILHLMVPSLFVMWDRPIKHAISEPDYGRFMVTMHLWSRKLSEVLAPSAARSDLEEYLRHYLEYPVRKPLAKYLDEFNWQMVVGDSNAR